RASDTQTLEVADCDRCKVEFEVFLRVTSKANLRNMSLELGCIQKRKYRGGREYAQTTKSDFELNFLLSQGRLKDAKGDRLRRPRDSVCEINLQRDRKSRKKRKIQEARGKRPRERKGGTKISKVGIEKGQAVKGRERFSELC